MCQCLMNAVNKILIQVTWASIYLLFGCATFELTMIHLLQVYKTNVSNISCYGTLQDLVQKTYNVSSGTDIIDT